MMHNYTHVKNKSSRTSQGNKLVWPSVGMKMTDSSNEMAVV